ncbi:hypothetical protein K440DRAFT_307059 [Wilcoxina mikolae CBS 423.85]|nr:hypothetical protein K440DRAFT_307059 [Wilcoxina mikolae CBS 423.85]
MSLCRFIPLASLVFVLAGEAVEAAHFTSSSTLPLFLPTATTSQSLQLELPTASTTIYTSTTSENGLSVGTIIGLVLGLSALAVILLFVTIFLIQKRKRDKAEIVEVGQGRWRAEEGAGLATSAAPMATGGRGS